MSPLQALGNLVEQLELGNYVDDHGHKIENLQALHDAKAIIAGDEVAIRIEDHVLIFHEGCIGVITGPLTHMVCAECGAVMNGMVGEKRRPNLVVAE